MRHKAATQPPPTPKAPSTGTTFKVAAREKEKRRLAPHVCVVLLSCRTQFNGHLVEGSIQAERGGAGWSDTTIPSL